MKIKISKKEWELAGKKSGWLNRESEIVNTQKNKLIPFSEELVRTYMEYLENYGEIDYEAFESIVEIMNDFSNKNNDMDTAVFLMILRNECQARLRAMYGMGLDNGNPTMFDEQGYANKDVNEVVNVNEDVNEDVDES